MPLLVRGALDQRLIAGMLVFGAIMVVVGFHVRYRNPGRLEHWFAWFVAALFAMTAILLAIWHLPRRRWIEITLTGFVLTQRGKRLALADDAVVGFARRFTIDSSKVVHHHVCLEVELEGQTERIDCVYTVLPGLADPLAGFWQRILTRMGQRIRTQLAHGATLVGDDWRLDAAGLHHRHGCVPLDRITKVGYYGGRLCLWKEEEERPFLRLPACSRNVQPLGSLLRELRPQLSQMGAGLPSNPLGRILLDRRSLDWILGVVVLVIGLVVGLTCGGTVFIRGGRPSLLTWALLGLLLLFVWTAGVLFRRGLTARLIFHERGVSQPRGNGCLALLHEEIGTVIWKPGPSIMLIPRDGLDRPTISFEAAVSRADEDLSVMRDQICSHLAACWAKEVATGPVRWTPRLRFLPGGLQYIPRGLLGEGGPVTVPYHLTSFQIENGIFRLFVTGHTRAVCKERTDLPNFFVGLVLLQMIYRSYQPMADATLSASPGLPRDQRVMQPGSFLSRIIPEHP